ncbi:MAG: hypothetical protein JXQ71_17915 [Verrucomicrobia bacterium]|nr:hypothetical protein [Verrucomicrobiota bacterium]
MTNRNRLTLSARLGFNVSARFKGTTAGLTALANSRTTPLGHAYTYDDGYVLTDSSGNAGGQTWYWGYDDSASQISGNTILMSRSTPAPGFASPSCDDDAVWGTELTYQRWLGQWRRMHYGLEAAANWQTFGVRDSSTYYGNAVRLQDAYPFTPGTTPPAATLTPNNPYQGSFGDEGFLLGDTSVSSTTRVLPQGVEISGRRRYEADLWGFRLGPYVTLPLADRVNLWLSGGLAVGLLDGEASWSESVSLAGNRVSSAGRGSDFDVLWGAFAAANVSWDFHRRWSATAGVQYQYLGTYEAGFGDRRVEVDLSQSFFVLLGVGYSF